MELKSYFKNFPFFTSYCSQVTLASLVHRLASQNSAESFFSKIPGKILTRVSNFRQILSTFERGDDENLEQIHVWIFYSSDDVTRIF
jgi:hypothetical protein